MELEKFEVRCDLYLFRRDVVLTPSQRERKRKELEREKQEKEARERKEGFEVRRDPHLFRQSTVLTTSQERQREFGREMQENKARERKEELEVCCNTTFSGGTSLQPRRRDKGNLNARGKRPRLENVRKSSRYVAISALRAGCSNSVAEGKETEET